MHPHEDNPSFGPTRGEGAVPLSGDGQTGEDGSSQLGEMYTFSRKSIRELDQLAASEFGMPTIVLMENAARGSASIILDGVEGLPDPRALIVAGVGNNGGDGLAIARHLHNADVRVGILLVGDESKLTPDARVNLGIVEKMGLWIGRATSAESFDSGFATFQQQVGDVDVVIDALLGTGVDRAVAAGSAPGHAIERMKELHEAGVTVVSIDLPSGLDADTGEPAGGGEAVAADLTLTLGGIKAGFLKSVSDKYVGEVVVVDIGVPIELIRRLGRKVDEEVLKHGGASAG